MPPDGLALAELDACLHGEIPCLLATAAADGVPNIVYLSQAIIVDDDHIAVSNQFLSKTMANLAVNPVAMIHCIDPTNGLPYKVLLRHLRSETDGERFEDARMQLEAIAAYTGMQDVFALSALEVFRVLDVAAVPIGNPPT